MKYSFREFSDALPKSIVALAQANTYEVLSHPRLILMHAAEEVQIFLDSRCRQYLPEALRVLPNDPEARFDSAHDDRRLIFAAIGALCDEGFQPFAANLAPPPDHEVAGLLPDIGLLIQLVQQDEPLYQEQASRWLVAAHFYEQFRAYLEESPGFSESSLRMTPEQAAIGVGIINKWWPWVEAIEAASKSGEWVDWKGLGASGLHPNARATSFRKLLASLPEPLSGPLRVKDARESLQRCGSEALSTAAIICRASKPDALRKAISETALMRSDFEFLTRFTFAAIARLSDEGFQPFLSSLTPPNDPGFDEFLPSADALIRLVQQDERLYQEQASRWLVAAHCHAQLRAYSKDNPECFLGHSYDNLMTIEQAEGLVAILNKWWPWVAICDKAISTEGTYDPARRLRDGTTNYIDWKHLFGATELRPNARRTSKRRRTSRRSSRRVR